MDLAGLPAERREALLKRAEGELLLDGEPPPSEAKKWTGPADKGFFAQECSDAVRESKVLQALLADCQALGLVLPQDPKIWTKSQCLRARYGCILLRDKIQPTRCVPC